MPLPSSVDVLLNFITSRQLLPGSWANAITSLLTSIASITASVTQTQAGATAITTASVEVTTGNANDAVRLPKGYAGLEIFIANPENATLGVFPAVGDTISPSAVNAVLAQTAVKNAVYKVLAVTAAGAATWYKVESA